VNVAGAAERVAPYVDMTLASPPDLAQVAASSGARLFNLAFITAGKTCEPTWGGVTRHDDAGIARRIRELRQAGGDVRVSFGGARPPELAERCHSVQALTAAYRKVIDAHHVVRADFDIEGPALKDGDTVRRRNQAISRLQAYARLRGTPLRVSYTLPADPLALTEEARVLLRDARDAGVRVEVVNVMAMNYGTRPSDMAAPSMAVAESTKTFIQDLWPGTSESQAWRMVAVTPMIGMNDITAETFRLEDAVRLVEFARRHGLGWLSYWSMNRDRRCPAGTADNRAQDSCSGVSQRPGDFLKIFAEYARPTR
jgi:hypothetical protein